ncbi:MAG: RNA polymerase sigma factor [Cellulomonas sp.]|uniref:RNA polymerase sigma factor n=1 Tax=Cellulomonas sp. TaxID=40001 RepID=UPI00183BF942|nr:RNA polymerase sigma factor [Cellulomonas sp.]NMM31746.1 RNA polymerase sigma factor [Cellulomonas sp.]
MSATTTSDEGRRFASLWETHARRVYAYAARHTDPDSAQDVVAETFLVAWRRLADVPGDPLPWLLVVARNTLANRRRSAYRHRLLELELGRLLRVARPATAADVPVHARDEVLRAVAQLTDAEREAVLLAAWDGLSPQQAAHVAGCSVTPSAFASWTPTPAVATAAQTAAAQGQCEVVLHGSVEQTQRYPTPVVNPWLPTSDAELAGRRVLVAEQRGTFTYVLSSNGAWTVGYLYSAALGDGSTTASTTRLSLFPPAPGAGTVDVLDRGGVGVPGGESAVLASGRAGRDVVGVDVVTPAGRTVTASVASGYWSAWWPADEKVDDSLNQARMIVHRKDGSTDEVGTLGSLVPKPSYADTDPTPAPASTAG